MAHQDSLLQYILADIEAKQYAQYADLFTLLNEYPEQVADPNSLAKLLEAQDISARFPLDDVRVYLCHFHEEDDFDMPETDNSFFGTSAGNSDAKYSAVFAFTQKFRSFFSS